MSTENPVMETVKKVFGNSEDVARSIWLAGLGAYGRSLEEAQQRVEQTNQLFEELVDKGREVERVSQEKITEARDQTRRSVEDRVNQLFDRLSGVDRAHLEELNDKVDKLAVSVEQLSQSAERKAKLDS